MYEKFSHYEMEVLAKYLISNTYGIGMAIGKYKSNKYILSAQE